MTEEKGQAVSHPQLGFIFLVCWEVYKLGVIDYKLQNLMAWMVNKWVHMTDWPRQKGIEPLFVMFVIVLNELIKQCLNHTVLCPVCLREPNRLTKQLNSGYSSQGKNRFGVPRNQGLGFFCLVGWWGFFIWEGNLVPVIRTNWGRILRSHSYVTFCFTSNICTLHSRLRAKY